MNGMILFLAAVALVMAQNPPEVKAPAASESELREAVLRIQSEYNAADAAFSYSLTDLQKRLIAQRDGLAKEGAKALGALQTLCKGAGKALDAKAMKCGDAPPATDAPAEGAKK